MKAGARNKRIILLRAAVSTDDYGGRETSWDVLATVWAEHMPASDGERIRAAQLGATLTDRFRILKGPAWADLNPKDQLDYAGRRYGIEAVKPFEDDVGFEITATARADT